MEIYRDTTLLESNKIFNCEICLVFSFSSKRDIYIPYNMAGAGEI